MAKKLVDCGTWIFGVWKKQGKNKEVTIVEHGIWDEKLGTK